MSSVPGGTPDASAHSECVTNVGVAHSCPLSPAIGTAFGVDSMAGERAGVRGAGRHRKPLTPALSSPKIASTVGRGGRGTSTDEGVAHNWYDLDRTTLNELPLYGTMPV